MLSASCSSRRRARARRLAKRRPWAGSALDEFVYAKHQKKDIPAAPRPLGETVNANNPGVMFRHHEVLLVPARAPRADRHVARRTVAHRAYPDASERYV